MIDVFIYLIVSLIGFYILFSFLKPKSTQCSNPHAHHEKTPEEMKTPIYRPFKDGPFQMTMGIRSLSLHQWIEIDPQYRVQIEEKKNLLKSSRRNDLFIYNDDAYAGSLETLEMLIDYLPSQFPQMFERNCLKTKIFNRITGETFDLSALNEIHPLEIASRLVQEDLVIMQLNPNEQMYHANALCVCFPSGWLPKSKFQLPLGAIHVPHVPFFQEKLRTSIDRYFLKLKVENPIQRLNWTIQIGNNLCQTIFDETSEISINEENAGEFVYLRVERQTLRRLPKSETILFTIKTYTTKMTDVARNHPDVAKRLANALRNWPPEMKQYKASHLYEEGLLAYLDKMSSSEALSS